MFITVIIVAYDRKQFILEAIKSVLNQTLSKEMYEVIVIKNYSDNNIDEFTRKNRINNIISKKKSLSGKLYTALQVSNGEVISFLEDDDKFYPDKLEYVFNNFEKDQNLVYYHNSCVFEEDNGNELPFIFNSPGFNLSSISIKKSIINMEGLESIPDAVDSFFYYNAIDSGGKILDDKVILTHYRFHESASNYIGDFETTLEHKIERFKSNIDNYNLIIQCLKTDKAIDMLLNNIITTKINVNILCSLTHKENFYHFSIKELWFWLSYPVYYRRKFPFLFKIVRCIELIMPTSLKLILERKIFEKTKA